MSFQTTLQSPVPTPEPTPVNSPIPSPRRKVSPLPSPDLSPPASQKEDKPLEQAAAYVDESTEEDVTLPPMPEPTEGDILWSTWAQLQCILTLLKIENIHVKAARHMGFFYFVERSPPSSRLISRHDVLTPIATPADEPEKPYTPDPSVEDIPTAAQPQVPYLVHISMPTACDSSFCVTGRERLIRSHSSARFCFELSRNSN